MISAAVDQANISACYAMERLGKYVPYSYDLACKVTNKGYMKNLMLENGIPTSKYIYIDRQYDLENINIDFPVMVKPADSNSSNGVKKAHNREELKNYLDQAIVISRNHKAVVEEVMQGLEISAYCYVSGGVAKLLMTQERLSITEESNAAIKCYASIAPARISEKAKIKAENIATQIARVFGLDNTPLFFQGMVNGDNIDVIEFAPRVSGGMPFFTIRDGTGFDILEATIDSYTGKKISFNTWHEPDCVLAVNQIYGGKGIFSRLVGMDELIKEGVVTHCFLHKTPGMVLDDQTASASRVAAFIVKAQTVEEVKCAVAEAFDRLDVLDVNGNSIIRKDLNIAEQLKIDVT